MPLNDALAQLKVVPLALAIEYREKFAVCMFDKMGFSCTFCFVHFCVPSKQLCKVAQKNLKLIPIWRRTCDSALQEPLVFLSSDDCQFLCSNILQKLLIVFLSKEVANKVVP